MGTGGWRQCLLVVLLILRGGGGGNLLLCPPHSTRFNVTVLLAPLLPSHTEEGKNESMPGIATRQACRQAGRKKGIKEAESKR
jgi:hypothetical protein